MISSMTGYGRAEVTRKGITAVVEVRSVNNRFLEVTSKLPRSIMAREGDIKDLIRKKIGRGKLNITVSLGQGDSADVALRINQAAVRTSYKLLNDLRKAAKIRDKITLEHLLKFSEVLEPLELEESDTREWSVIEDAVNKALDQLHEMRTNEGRELTRDLLMRLDMMSKRVDEIESISRKRVPEERDKLRERIAQLIADPAVVDGKRLELEIALLADKLDVTEECVRFRSHTKFFVDALDKDDSAGRKLNFLLQEMNREANTIGSKSDDADISHKVVAVKEELEKIREQLQNIE
jgi:uncharacterized protein (TIGR00255 family)